MSDPMEQLRAAVARSRDAAAGSRRAVARTTARLRAERTEVERAHRDDPAYGTAARERGRRRGPGPPP